VAKSLFLWLPFVFLPLVAWSRDLAVVAVGLGSISVLFQREMHWRGIAAMERRAPSTRVFVGFVLWSFAAVLWAPHLPFVAWLKVYLALGAIYVLVIGLSRLPISTVNHLKMPAITATIALFVLLLFERLTDGLLIRFDRASDTSAQILNTLSGGLVLLCCISFPIAWILWRQTKKWIWSAAFVAACFGLSLSYRMDAVPAGLIAGISAFLIVLYGRKPALVTIAVLVGGVALVWAPLAIGASALNVDSWFIENVDRNWGYRVIIWSHVGELLQDHFLIGYGFDASRIVGASADLLPERKGTSTFLHPHNGMLQIWLELGLVGVILFAAAAVLLFRRVLMKPPSTGAMAAAAGTLGFSATLWLVSYGVWQGWWLAVLGLAASAVILVFRIDASTESG
jgi:O-antigen ligase